MTQSVVHAELASPVRRVWEVLTDLNHQDWRSDIERVEVTGETTFVEYTKGGVLSVKQTRLCSLPKRCGLML